jgi:hypothetical protein
MAGTSTLAVTAERPAARPRPPAGFRLRRRAHRWALWAHVLTSAAWFGVAVMVVFCAIAAATTHDPALSHALYRTLETVPWLSIPVGLASVATGGLLSVGTTYGLLRHWWVVAKIVISALVIGTDALLVRRVAHHAVLVGHGSGPLRDSTIAHVVVLGVATWLSVFKPRGRTPLGRRKLGRDPA